MHLCAHSFVAALPHKDFFAALPQDQDKFGWCCTKTYLFNNFCIFCCGYATIAFVHAALPQSNTERISLWYNSNMGDFHMITIKNSTYLHSCKILSACLKSPFVESNTFSRVTVSPLNPDFHQLFWQTTTMFMWYVSRFFSGKFVKKDFQTSKQTRKWKKTIIV